MEEGEEVVGDGEIPSRNARRTGESKKEERKKKRPSKKKIWTVESEASKSAEPLCKCADLTSAFGRNVWSFAAKRTVALVR